MNFTASSFERMMKQKPRPQAPAQPNRPEAPPAPVCPLLAGPALCLLLSRNFLPGRAAGGDAFGPRTDHREGKGGHPLPGGEMVGQL